ncbi:MAG: SLBB domain-containing protein [Burkholderiales bacterium]
MDRIERMLRRATLVASLLAGVAVPNAVQAQDPGRLFGAGDPASAAAAMGAGGGAAGLGAGGAGFGGAGFGGADLGPTGAGGFGAMQGLRGRGPSLPQGMVPGGAGQLDANAAAGVPRPLPPLEPNDVQKFVQASTGRLLPLFGATLFEEAPTSYAPVGGVPVPADYVIGPGDEIVVRSTGVLDFELCPVVDRDGQIVLPKVGAVQVAGTRMADLEQVLTRQVGKSFRNFTLSATLGQLRGIDVYVVGQARRPGKYTLSSLSTLVNALFASGGPNAHGSLRRVRLVRADRTVVSIDLYDFIVRGDKSKDVRLLPGDTIVFPAAGPRVALAGAVNLPAVYELVANDTPIREVLALSGGLPVLADPLRALLERVDGSKRAARTVEQFGLDEAGLGRTLRDGDVLSVQPISPQFANAVTLRGNVAAPLRYPFRPGMRVRDLIPEREALITRDYWLRKNLMVQFEEPVREGEDFDPRGASERSGRTDPARGDAGRGSGAVLRDSAVLRDAATKDAGQRVSAERARQDLKSVFDEPNWDYAVIERLDAAEMRPRLIPFNLGRAVLQQDDAHNLELQPGDVVTVFSQRDLRVPRSRQTRLVRIEGEVAAPGIYNVESGETLPQLIARIGGATRDAYLFGTELTRESVRQQQQDNLQTIVRRLEDQTSSGIAARQQTLQAGTAADQAAQAQRLAVEEKIARERLQRLRSMKPTGRISLELDPDTPALPAIALEDGDRIVLPPRPSFVAVVGSVYNENSLLWRQGKTVDDYLQAAGLTDGADIDNVFVLRADGSIASRRVGAWGRAGVGALRLSPGDTIVVPEKVDRETKYAAFMRGLKDWTQVVYQLGLGAAAIKVLRD